MDCSQLITSMGVRAEGSHSSPPLWFMERSRRRPPLIKSDTTAACVLLVILCHRSVLLVAVRCDPRGKCCEDENSPSTRRHVLPSPQQSNWYSFQSTPPPPFAQPAYLALELIENESSPLFAVGFKPPGAARPASSKAPAIGDELYASQRVDGHAAARREEKVPAGTVQQAVCHPGTHLINGLPQRFTDLSSGALVFTADPRPLTVEMK
ncbi:unnamed protein product [Pleuronectes platessa]|uniref:Uncharacterized protein n=1 Tax=Pleuronectes platessa TaxID=8262 RepID=A0A9N7UGZ8_PLEPL|nr:unnamed protein product [Pleuronectes platessa]